MAGAKTNKFSMRYAIEDTPGVLTSTEWKLLEPNDITTWGGEITTVPRDPISDRRQRRKGVPTDLDSNVEFEHDLTLEVFTDFAEGFAFANFTGAEVKKPTACDTDSYTVPSGDILAQNTLVYGRGASNSTNNGLKVVDTGATATDVPVTTALVAETFSAVNNVTLEVAGVRGASGDLTLTVSGTTGTLGSTTLDFTTLDIVAGQFIHIGGLTATNQFDNGYGYARITSVAANAVGLDKLDSALATDTGTGKQIDILFGRFLKNVGVNDANFLERTITFEGDFTSSLTNRYEYPNGNYCNTMALNSPLTDKATITYGFVGLDTPIPTSSRKTGADTPILPVQTAAFSTSIHIARLRITEVDETGITTDFSDLTVTINNNAGPEKILGTLGATEVNIGNIEVGIEGQALFTSSAVIEAIRNNDTVTMEFIYKNGDGAIALDIPSMTLGDGSREFPRNETIKINETGQAFEDATLGSSIGISLFPVVP